MKNETSGDILYIKQHHTKNRMSAAAFIVESSLDKVSWSYVYAEFRYPVIVGSTAGRYFHFPFWLQLWIKITSSRSPVDLRPPTESLDRELSESEEFCGWFMKRKKSYCTPSVVTNFPESRKSPNGYEPPQTQNRAIMW